MALIRRSDPRLGELLSVFPPLAPALRSGEDAPRPQWQAVSTVPRVEETRFPVLRREFLLPSGETGGGSSTEHGEELSEEEKSAREAAAALEEAHRESREEGLQEGRALGHQLGRQEGLREGEEQGYRRGMAEAEELRKKIDRAWLRFQEEAAALRSAYGAAVSELAVRVAGKVVGLERSKAPQTLVSAVQAAVEQLGPKVAVRLILSPEDLERVRPLLESSASLRERGMELELIEDSGLEAGDFLLDSDLGGVDGRVAVQLDEILRRLQEAQEHWEPIEQQAALPELEAVGPGDGDAPME